MKKFLLNIWYTILYQFDQHRNEIPVWWYEQKPLDEQPDWVQRVIIAKDVIAQIEAERYFAKGGSYIRISEEDDYRGSVKENFQNIKHCKVCALGGCFLSIVRFKNNVDFDELTDIGAMQFAHNNKFKQILTSIFSIQQLILIENAFENGWFGESPIFGSYDEKYSVSRQDKHEAWEFGQQFSNQNDRLIAIMQNIIDNKGTFKP